VLYCLGRYTQCKKIDWARVNRIVFLCHGNICRSSLAEYYARNLGANTVSCGLACRGNDPADKRAINFAADIGLDLTVHTTTNIKDVVFSGDDLLVAMEPAHLDGIKKHNTQGAQITLAGLWGDNNKSAYIHDPYSAIDEHFLICGNNILCAVRGLVEQLR
jgi:protein-tyrosine phosphatase